MDKVRSALSITPEGWQTVAVREGGILPVSLLSR